MKAKSRTTGPVRASGAVRLDGRRPGEPGFRNDLLIAARTSRRTDDRRRVGIRHGRGHGDVGRGALRGRITPSDRSSLSLKVLVDPVSDGPLVVPPSVLGSIFSAGIWLGAGILGGRCCSTSGFCASAACQDRPGSWIGPARASWIALCEGNGRPGSGFRQSYSAAIAGALAICR